jgi:hypothetical protein
MEFTAPDHSTARLCEECIHGVVAVIIATLIFTWMTSQMSSDFSMVDMMSSGKTIDTLMLASMISVSAFIGHAFYVVLIRPFIDTPSTTQT